MLNILNKRIERICKDAVKDLEGSFEVTDLISLMNKYRAKQKFLSKNIDWVKNINININLITYSDDGDRYNAYVMSSECYWINNTTFEANIYVNCSRKLLLFDTEILKKSLIKSYIHEYTHVIQHALEDDFEDDVEYRYRSCEVEARFVAKRYVKKLGGM